jgi:hypothetical protein
MLNNTETYTLFLRSHTRSYYESHSRASVGAPIWSTMGEDHSDRHCGSNGLLRSELNSTKAFLHGSYNLRTKTCDTRFLRTVHAQFALDEFSCSLGADGLRHYHRPMASPSPTSSAVAGSIAGRESDVNSSDDQGASSEPGCPWPHILVASKLRSSLRADKVSNAWLDLFQYVTEVLAARSSCSIVRGCMLCRSLTRL